MKYKNLQEPCKTAISQEKCLGCNNLENPNFTGDKNCIYLKNELGGTNDTKRP